MRARSTLVLLALFALPAFAAAQQAAAPAPTGPTVDGILFQNWNMRTDSAAKAQTGGKNPNRFDVGRVYVNVRAPAGEKGSIRVTSDIFQNTGGGGYYAGWTIRLKYGFFQYEATRKLMGVDGLVLTGKAGMTQTVVVEHIEQFWPRWMGNTAVEGNGFFSSSDVGVASTVTLPKRRGEAYVTVMNGNGYTSAETDRFKDIGARFSWTPFGNDSGFIRTLTITPWYVKGRGAGLFPAGGAGQQGPGTNGAITDGVQRDRRGLFVGVRDRRFTGGADYAQRVEEIESGLNTVASPRVVRNRTSTLTSAFAFVRPMELADKSKRSRLTVFGRFDNFDFDDAPKTVSKLVWGGLLWDLNQRATFTIDYQQLKSTVTPPAGAAVTTPTKTVFLHWVVTY